MKRLWAPWRMSFILDCDKSKCIFCELSKQSSDRESLILYRSKRVFVLMNKFPYSNGHVMVAPYDHSPKLGTLNGETLHELSDVLKLAVGALEHALHPDGLNIGINQGKVAGAGYAGHLHYHVVPRWLGDTNFMPVTAETKVMADHLHNTYDKILPYFQKLVTSDK